MTRLPRWLCLRSKVRNRLGRSTAVRTALVVFLLVLYVFAKQQFFVPSGPGQSPEGYHSEIALQQLFRDRKSDVQILGKGVVTKVLPDDRTGSKHQKFILQVGPEQTVLVAHNIDVAKRLPGLQTGDSVEFYGEYEWTAKGGVIHWTHRDLWGRHLDGWLKYNGKTYQ